MSVMSRDVARRSRIPAVNLTPWARAAIGPTDGWVLPPDYRIVAGSARTPLPVTLRLLAPGGALVEVRTGSTPTAAREAFAALVEAAWVHSNLPRCVLCHRPIDERRDAPAMTVVVGEGTGSLCSVCQDRHLHDEPERYVVTVGPGDWIEGMEDA